MCRLLGYCSRDAASVAELLGTESFRAFTSLSDLHGDGWGMSWYAGSRPAAWKSAARASREPEYDKLAWQPLGDLGLVHLRWATPGLAVSDVNTHPFRYGDHTFAHNGAIYPQERLGEMLPPEWERRLAGSTDSERYFLHLMWRLAARDGDMVAAIADTTAAISQRYTASSLNAILLAPDALYAISFHDRSMVPADLLRELGHGERPEEVAAYFDLAYQVTGDAVLVASSGWPMPGWTPLPSGHVLVTDRRTLATSVLPITASLPRDAACSPVNDVNTLIPNGSGRLPRALERTRLERQLAQVLRVAAARPALGAGRADRGVLEEVTREPAPPQLFRHEVDEVVSAVPAVQGVSLGRHASPVRLT
jgi:predicted glutamine amidotransferase